MTHPRGWNQNTDKTHCKNGHAFTKENTYISPKGGRSCRICMRAKYSRRYETRGGRTAGWRQWKYGITPEQYEKMYAAQNGKCAIRSCPNPISHIDHDHRTDEVRGLLCKTCNWGLGHFKDSPTLLREAAEYLENHHEGQ